MSHGGARTTLAAIAWCFGASISPAYAACVLSEPEAATVAEIIDGETLKLGDGRIVRLIGAKAPAPPLGWRGLSSRSRSKHWTSSRQENKSS